MHFIEIEYNKYNIIINVLCITCIFLGLIINCVRYKLNILEVTIYEQ